MQNRSWQVIGSSQRWHHDLAMVARPAAKIRTCCISACLPRYEQDVWGASAAGLREGLRMCVSRLRDCIGMLAEMHAMRHLVSGTGVAEAGLCARAVFLEQRPRIARIPGNSCNGTRGGGPQPGSQRCSRGPSSSQHKLQ